MSTLGSMKFDFVLSTMNQAGYAGVFVLMLLESATLPVPSEVVLPFAGYLVYLGFMNFWLAVLAATLGSLIGTTIDFVIGYYLGRPAILRFGRSIHLSEKHLALSESWFRKHGSLAVLAGRFVPLVRTLIAFPAGIVKMSIAKFLIYSLAGIFVWDFLLIYVGLYFGQNSSAIISSLYTAFFDVEIAVIVGAIVLLLLAYLHNLKKNKRAAEERKM